MRERSISKSSLGHRVGHVIEIHDLKGMNTPESEKPTYQCADISEHFSLNTPNLSFNSLFLRNKNFDYRFQCPKYKMPFGEEWWTTKIAHELHTFIAKNGLSDVKEFFEAKLDHWKHIKVNIAITGEAGAGKSSFINKIRG